MSPSKVRDQNSSSSRAHKRTRAYLGARRRTCSPSWRAHGSDLALANIPWSLASAVHVRRRRAVRRPRVAGGGVEHVCCRPTVAPDAQAPCCTAMARPSSADAQEPNCAETRCPVIVTHPDVRLPGRGDVEHVRGPTRRPSNRRSPQPAPPSARGFGVAQLGFPSPPARHQHAARARHSLAARRR